MMSDIKICTNCVMDTTDSKITFDKNGVCDHCNTYCEDIEPVWNYGKGREDELEQTALDNPDKITIITAGIVSQPPDIVERTAKLPNVKYLGTYKSLDDLPELYRMVDIVWACYHYPSKTDMNWQWARINRFY